MRDSEFLFSNAFEESNKGLSFPAVSNVTKFVLSLSSRAGKFALIPIVVTKYPLLFI